jgi:hypothetical protein
LLFQGLLDVRNDRVDRHRAGYFPMSFTANTVRKNKKVEFWNDPETIFIEVTDASDIGASSDI